MKATDLPIYHGGLMRCCLATLEDIVVDEPPKETVVPCKWCESSVILDQKNHSGLFAWRWNRAGPVSPPVV